MANSLSAKKRVRQNEKRRVVNQARKSVLKTQQRKFSDALGSKDSGAAQKELIVLVQKLDRAAVKRTIHPNAAARTKSRLQKRLNAMKKATA